MIDENFALKKGDVVLVYATVKYDRRHPTDRAYLEVDGRSVSVDMDEIHGLAKPKLDIDDMVSWNDGACVGKIQAMTETHAWIEGDYGYTTLGLHNIQPKREPLSDEATTELHATEPPPVSDVEPAIAAPTSDEILF